MQITELYQRANLNPGEIRKMKVYIDGDEDFYGTPAYEKLYEYFVFETGEMPYGTAKARDGDPDLWILEEIENLDLLEA